MHSQGFVAEGRLGGQVPPRAVAPFEGEEEEEELNYAQNGLQTR
jgi:hypothetical protein